MASPAAELWCLHVLYSPIGDLGSDQNIEKSSDCEKPGNTTQSRLAVKGSPSQPLADPPLGREIPIGTKTNPVKKMSGRTRKTHSNVRVDVPTNLLRQHEKPRNDSRRKQSNTQQTQPVLS